MSGTKVKPVVLFGPSGCGKSTLKNRLLKDYPDKFGFSVSHTTRSPRPGETNGKEYHFTNREAMQQSIDAGNFIESAVYNENLYGTSKKAVQDVLDAGKVCLLDIDMQGVLSLKKTDMDCYYIFVKTPSLEGLERRLRARGSETEESLSRRLDIAKIELAYADEPDNFHKVIINDDFEKAYSEFKDTISQFKFNDLGKNKKPSLQPKLYFTSPNSFPQAQAVLPNVLPPAPPQNDAVLHPKPAAQGTAQGAAQGAALAYEISLENVICLP